MNNENELNSDVLVASNNYESQILTNPKQILEIFSKPNHLLKTIIIKEKI